MRTKRLLITTLCLLAVTTSTTCFSNTKTRSNDLVAPSSYFFAIDAI